MTRTPRRRLGALILGAAALCITLSSPAMAGTAKVYSCTAPDGTYASTAGWTESTVTAGQAHVDGVDRCSTQGRFSAEFFHPGTTWSPGPRSGWSYTAPADTTIANVALERTLYGLGAGHWNYNFYVGSARVEHSAPSTNVAWGRKSVDTADATTFSLALICGGPANCSRDTSSTTAATLAIRKATITLRDSRDPLVSSVAGGLAADDTLQGTESMSFAATDAGLGVYREVVEVDGRQVSADVVDENDGRCSDAGQDPALAYEFRSPVPCKAGTNGELSLDTTTLPDGDHTLRVWIEDAAGNSATAVGPKTVRVDNVPPPSLRDGSAPSIEGSPRSGEALRGVPGEWNGADVTFAYQWQRCDADGGGCAQIGTATGQQHLVSQRDVGHRLRVRVTASNGEGSSSATSEPTAVIAAPSTTENRTPTPQRPAAPRPGGGGTAPGRGEPNGAGASDRVRLSAYAGSGRRTTIRARYGRSTRITGRLLDANGQPIGGATLQVQAGIRIPGSPFEDVGTVRTDRDGNYTYTLAAGPSRLVRFGYRSHVGDSQFADTTDVVIMVRAGVTLRPRPTKLRNGRTTTFSGSVGRPVPTRGVLVDLQVRVGKKWRTFAVARSRRNGRYSFRYRFRNTYRTTTFKFRARARRDSRYPYLDGYSRIVKVKVRG